MELQVVHDLRDETNDGDDKKLPCRQEIYQAPEMTRLKHGAQLKPTSKQQKV
jgi:hypothetical protein